MNAGRSIGLGAALTLLLVATVPGVTLASAAPQVGKTEVPTAVARNPKEALDLLERHLGSSGRRILLLSPHDYLPGILLPSRRAGYLDEVIGVLPIDSPLGEGQLKELIGYLEKAGISEAERGTFHLDNGSIRGSAEGLAISLHSLSGFLPQGRESLLVIDTAFLLSRYVNEVRTPMVDLALKVGRTLEERGVATRQAVVLDGVGRPDFPMEHGFLASLLRDVLSEPRSFAQSLPEKWGILKAAEQAYFFSQFADGMRLFREYLRESPGDASACYKIAMMALRDLDPEMALHWINKAAEADPLYRRAYKEAAVYLFRKELFEEAEQIFLAGLSKFPKDPVLSTNLSAMYLSRGEAMREAGEAEAAAGYFGRAASVEGAEPAMRERAEAMVKSIHLPGDTSDEAHPAPEGVPADSSAPAETAPAPGIAPPAQTPRSP